MPFDPVGSFAGANRSAAGGTDALATRPVALSFAP